MSASEGSFSLHAQALAKNPMMIEAKIRFAGGIESNTKISLVVELHRRVPTEANAKRTIGKGAKGQKVRQ